VSTQQGTRNTKRVDLIGVSAGSVAHERLDARVTVLAIEQVLGELEIHPPLSDLVRGPQSIETAIMQSRSRCKLGDLC
jgi:hypothetical protein